MMFYSFGATDKGKVRLNNEDNFSLGPYHLSESDKTNNPVYYDIFRDRTLCAVCDGIGGNEYGEVASEIAASCISSAYSKLLSISDYSDVELDRQVISACVRHANRKIIDKGNELDCFNMGTTCALLYLDNNTALVCSVGDSRVYHFRGGCLTRLSKDQTQLQSYIDAGLIDPNSTDIHVRKGALTGFLGISTDAPVVNQLIPSKFEVAGGDVFLLCSDGLSDMVDDESISHIISDIREPADLHIAAETLLRTALDRGGKDNITLVLILADNTTIDSIDPETTCSFALPACDTI